MKLRYYKQGFYHESFYYIKFSRSKALFVAKSLIKFSKNYSFDVRVLPTPEVKKLSEAKQSMAGACTMQNNRYRIYISKQPTDKRCSKEINNANLWATFFHELAHVVEPNHSNSWKRVMKRMVTLFVTNFTKAIKMTKLDPRQCTYITIDRAPRGARVARGRSAKP